MDMTPKEYQQYVQQKSKKSPILKDVALAFVIGGLILYMHRGNIKRLLTGTESKFTLHKKK